MTHNLRKVLVILPALLLQNQGAAQQNDEIRFELVYGIGTIWKAELDTSGDWFDEHLWTNGVPDANLPAFLINASETRLDSGNAVALSLSMSVPGYGRSRMTQTGGELVISERIQIHDGIYQQLGGSLQAESLAMGTFGEFSPLPDPTDVPKPETQCTPQGNGICIPDLILLATEKRFVLDGGETVIDETVEIGQGHLEVHSGSLTAGSMLLDARGWINSEQEIVQSGGMVTLSGELKIQDGTYALSGGTLQLNQLAMGDPSDVTLNWFSLTPQSRTPEFLQTGGTVRIEQNLELCIPGFILPDPSGPTFTDVTYRMQAGTLDVAGDTVVGSLGTAPAQFLQSGGTHQTNGELRIEGEDSRYALTGGTLQIGSLSVGTNVFNEGGTLELSAEGELIVESSLRFGELARVEASVGSKIRVEGGEIEVWGDDPGRITDLDQLSLEIVGGDETSLLEAASADLGDSAMGYADNFAWDDLLVGDADSSGHLKLVDNFENLAGADAVYVDHLIVSAESTLDLNGINLYYRTAEIAGSVELAGGIMAAVAVPEPAAIVLVCFAVGTIGGTRPSRFVAHAGHFESLHF